MKFIIAMVMCVSLASMGHAHPMTDLSEAQIFSVVDDMVKIGEDAAKTMVHQYEEIVVDPQQQLVQAVDQIDARREESPECVAQQDNHVNSILDTAHDEIHSCGVVAAHDSAEIAVDVSHASQQLVFGAVALRGTYNTCQNHKFPGRKEMCMIKFYVDLSVYMISSRSSIKTIQQSKNERIPAVFTDSNQCTHSASDKAVEALDSVHSDIDSCIARAARR